VKGVGCRVEKKRIEVRNLNKTYKINIPFIRKIIPQILSFVKNPQDAIKLEVVFLGDKEIRRLNKKYKRRDRPTDVLSFNISAAELKRKAFFGEVFISLDTALRNSGIYGTDFEEEAALYIIHGILHLFGYEDESLKDRLRMSKVENGILRQICEREDLSKVLTRR